MQIVNRPVIICRGKFAPGGNESSIGPPASGATITLYDSTANSNGLPGNPPLPFTRLLLNIYSSHIGGTNGLVFQSDFDGGNTNWRNQATQTLPATTPTTYDYLLRGDQAKIAFTNSANVLTAWEFTLIGVVGDRDAGVLASTATYVLL